MFHIQGFTCNCHRVLDSQVSSQVLIKTLLLTITICDGCTQATYDFH